MKFFLDKYLRPFAVAAVVLLAVGAAVRPLKNSVYKNSGEKINMAALKATTGGGMLFGILGGYRSLISDLAWVKSFIEWERKDFAGCLASMELATSIDPYMISFWTEGAATIAYDTPHWLMDNIPPNSRTPEKLHMFKMRQGETALNFLNRGLAILPDNDEMLIQKGQIAVSLDDFPLAEECFGKVAVKPNSPIYVRRYYGGVLMKNGKFEQAEKVFAGILNELDADSPILPVIREQMREAKELAKKTTNL